MGMGSAVRVMHDMLRGATDREPLAELVIAVAGDAVRGSRDPVELRMWLATGQRRMTLPRG
jgi:hypothetical protein